MTNKYKQAVAAIMFGLLLTACNLTPPVATEVARSTPVVQNTETPLATADVSPTRPPRSTRRPRVDTSQPVTIKYTYGGTVFKDVQLVEDAMNVILRERLNATIKLNPIDWGAYDGKTQLAFNSGEVCDIIFSAPWINNYVQKHEKKCAQ